MKPIAKRHINNIIDRHLSHRTMFTVDEIAEYEPRFSKTQIGACLREDPDYILIGYRTGYPTRENRRREWARSTKGR